MPRKIVITVEETDIPMLQVFINDQGSEVLQSSFTAAIGEAARDDVIRYKVFVALSDLSGYDISYISEGQDLALNLGLTLYQKRALKSYFNTILQELGGSANVSVRECEQLMKVRDCLNLVKSKL